MLDYIIVPCILVADVNVHFTFFWNEEAEKFEGRGKQGIVLGYGQMKAYLILDASAFESEKLSIHVTRDVQLHPDRFPFRKLVSPNDRKRDLSEWKKMFDNIAKPIPDFKYVLCAGAQCSPETYHFEMCVQKYSYRNCLMDRVIILWFRPQQ